jgi:alpha-L-rhamnosidase
VVINLYRDILGLYRLDTVAREVDVRFTDSPLAWCEGRVPVPDGAVSLHWTRDGGTLSYRFDAPAGYRVKVVNLGSATLWALPEVHTVGATRLFQGQ